MEPTTINPAGAPTITPVPPEKREREERVSIPLEPKEALRALLQVDPHAKPAEDR
jgi:hypothetical protein